MARAMIADLLQSDRGQSAHALYLVDAKGFEAWLGRQGPRVRAGIEAARFKAKRDELAILPGDRADDWSVAIGVTDADNLGPWCLAAAANRLPAGIYRLIDHTPGSAALGWLLAHYRFDRYRTAKDAEPPRILLTVDAASIEPTVRVAEATALVRDLVNTPAADMGPAELAEAVTREAKTFGAQVKIIEGQRLLEENYPAVHAVGRAASRPPRLIDLVWGNPTHPKLTLVGKGVCFDSGGLDIKPAAAMLTMKKDMGGAAHALALARLVMQAKLPVRLRLLIPAVENAISGDAFRPGDILATRKGLSVEIGNTDAEGRLILCDALAAAQEDKPDLLLDFATLTGAARIALGPELPALFTDDEALAADLAQASVATHDPLWRLPLWRPYREMLRSEVADINNASEGSFAGAITAALFLQRFVDSETAWAHIDLFAWSATTKPACPKGGDAMALRACWHMLQRRFIA